MTRYCPNCHAVVPDGSLNCPQCFTDVPRDGGISYGDHMDYRPGRDEYRENITKRRKHLSVAMFLAVFPPFFGILGLGSVYLDSRDRSGVYFLIGGLILFWFTVGMFRLSVTGGIVETILLMVPTIIAALVYLLTAFVSVLYAFTGSMFIRR